MRSPEQRCDTLMFAHWFDILGMKYAVPAVAALTAAQRRNLAIEQMGVPIHALGRGRGRFIGGSARAGERVAAQGECGGAPRAERAAIAVPTEHR